MHYKIRAPKLTKLEMLERARRYKMRRSAISIGGKSYKESMAQARKELLQEAKRSVSAGKMQVLKQEHDRLVAEILAEREAADA